MELKQLSKKRNYAMSLVLGSGGFYFGYYISCFNSLYYPMLTGDFGYDKEKDENILNTYSGLVNMIFCLGAMVGVLGSGYLSDKFGRRPILYAGEIIALIGLVPSLFAHVVPLMISRGISGVVTGVNSSMFSVIMTEVLPNKVSGFGNSFSYLAITVAILLAFVTQNIFSFNTISKNWRIFYVWPLIISIIRLILFPFFIKTDTPKYLFNKNQDPEIAKKNILEAYQTIYQPEDAIVATENAILLFEKQRSEGKVTILTLFSKTYRKRLFSGCSVAFIQQVSGIAFLIFYSTVIFDEIKEGYGKTMALMIGIANVVGSLMAIYLIEKAGRKFNLVGGVFIEAISWFVLYIGYHYKTLWVLIVACMAYMIAFAIGLGGTETAYISEILPPLGVGLSLGLQWFMNALIGIVVPILVKAVGGSSIILFFGIASFLLGFLLDYVTIETKGKSEKMIVQEFSEGKYRFFESFRKSPTTTKAPLEKQMNEVQIQQAEAQRTEHENLVVSNRAV